MLRVIDIIDLTFRSMIFESQNDCSIRGTASEVLICRCRRQPWHAIATAQAILPRGLATVEVVSSRHYTVWGRTPACRGKI